MISFRLPSKISVVLTLALERQQPKYSCSALLITALHSILEFWRAPLLILLTKEHIGVLASSFCSFSVLSVAAALQLRPFRHSSDIEPEIKIEPDFQEFFHHVAQVAQSNSCAPEANLETQRLGWQVGGEINHGGTQEDG